MSKPIANDACYHPDADRDTDALDLASAYLRHAGVAAGLWYLLPAAPVLVIGAWWIGVVTAGDRPALPAASLALAAAWALRWPLAVPLFARVLRDAGLRPHVTPRSVLTVFTARLAAHPAVMWGGLLVLPGVWAWGFSSVVTPCVLSDGRSPTSGVREAARLMSRHTGRVLRLTSSALLLATVGSLALIVTQLVMVTTLVPALTGQDPTSLNLAMRGPAWWLYVGLMIVLFFDFIWSVVSVFLAVELESQRSGRDLRLRLNHLRASTV